MSGSTHELLLPLRSALQLTLEFTRSIRVENPEHNLFVVLGIVNKVTAEAAMLLRCAYPLRSQDEQVRALTDELRACLLPLARSPEVFTLMAHDPAHIFELAAPHLILSHLGFPDERVDELIRQTVIHDDFGPERYAFERMQRAWLQGLWPALGRASTAAPLSALGRPLDCLAATTADLYALTHEVMYGTDFGRRPVRLGRTRAAIRDDADAALALSLLKDDLDLTAELLMLWPALGLRPTVSSTFALRVVLETEQRLGFLPGTAWRATEHQQRSASEAKLYVWSTSYHTTLVLGMLCALCLTARFPPVWRPAAANRRPKATKACLISLPQTGYWWATFQELRPADRDSLAPLLLNMQFRRLHETADIQQLPEMLQLALDQELTASAAVEQGVNWLNRLRLSQTLMTTKVTQLADSALNHT